MAVERGVIYDHEAAMQEHLPMGFLPERRVIRRQPMQELDQRIMGCVAWGSGLPACRYDTYEHERGGYKKVAIVQAGRFRLAHTNTIPHNLYNCLSSRTSGKIVICVLVFFQR